MLHWQFLRKVNILLEYDVTIVFLGIYHELRIYGHTKICTWIFAAALFLIDKTWKQWTNYDISIKYNLNQQ